MPTCYRHPDRPGGIVCQRCDRPICPSCMHQASVGFHCPECTKAGAQKVYRGPAAFQQRPTLTIALIAINVGVFVLGLILAGGAAMTGRSGELHVDLALTAKLWELGDTLYVGPVPGSEMIGVGAGQWYRIVTSGFLHFGLMHILFNMYALWILGRSLEQYAGRLRFGLLYAASIVWGSFGALLLSPQSLTAGASGGIYGLMGAIFLVERAQGIPFRESPILWLLGINLLLTFGLSGISIGGHVGGLVGGAAAAWAMFYLPKRVAMAPQVATGIAAALAVGAVVASIVFATNFQPTF